MTLKQTSDKFLDHAERLNLSHDNLDEMGLIEKDKSEMSTVERLIDHNDRDKRRTAAG